MIDRRAFLKGVAASYIATRIPADVYGLKAADAPILFPPHAMPGFEFQVRLHGNYTIAWPVGVRWQGGVAPVASGGNDLIRFVSGGDGAWYGAAIQDFR